MDEDLKNSLVQYLDESKKSLELSNDIMKGFKDLLSSEFFGELVEEFSSQIKDELSLKRLSFYHKYIINKHLAYMGT